MGLSLTVGLLAALRNPKHKFNEYSDDAIVRFRKQFDAWNRTLRKNGIQEYVEPEDVRPWSCDFSSYSDLSYLRRLASRLANDGKMPQPANEDEFDDELIDRMYLPGMNDPSLPFPKFSHLIVHSDCEGAYVPVRFERVIVTMRKGKDPEFLGSSPMLLAECKELATTLGIEGLDPESTEVGDAMKHLGEGKGRKRYGREVYTCLQLIRAAEYSIKMKSAVVFS